MALGDYFTGTYIGGSIAVIFAIWAFWLLLRRPSGRLGEERLEEKETEQLKKDELVVEGTQRDEKKQCKRIRKIIDELRTLGSSVESNFSIIASKTVRLIELSLNRLESEKMNVNVAMETFRLLHGSINLFISYLPKNYGAIDRLVAEINEIQKVYYADLIKEIEMHKRDKLELMRLLQQEMDQERRNGQLTA